MITVIASGAADGSTFFHDLVGVWRAKGTSIDSTLNVQRQKNGVIFLYKTGKFINKGWLYPNGRYKGETFSQGRKVEASLGTWRLNGTNVLEVFVKSHDGLGKSIIRRMNRDRFVYKETGNSAVTLARIRK